MSVGHGILAEPLQPGFSRICPHCLRWYALKFVRERPDEVAEKISTWRCRFCSEETEFARSHPRGAV